MSVNILLTDDHAIIRQGLETLIEHQTDMKVVGHASDGRQAVKLASSLKPHVVVMDVSMPNLNGIEATHQILKQMPTTKIVALSIHSHRRFIVGMLKAGASGYLIKDCVFEELLTAISMVLKNHIYLSPGIGDLVVEDYLRHIMTNDELEPCLLTEREKEVLQMIAEGVKTRDIASQLCVSISTIETHRRHIMRKLYATSVAELTKYAVREGMVSIDKAGDPQNADGMQTS